MAIEPAGLPPGSDRRADSYCDFARDVFLTIGTSAVVHPGACLVHHATRRGAMTVEINPDAINASGAVDVVLRGKAEEDLVELDAFARARLTRKD